VKDADEVKKLLTEYFNDYKTDEEKVSLKDSLNRITAQDVIVTEDIPGFDRSTVDGYAVHAKDTFGASEALPAILRLIPEVKVGADIKSKLSFGHAAYVPTGGQLPQDSDAMVMIEHTDDLKDGFIYVNKSVSPGNNVIYKGDDAKAGIVIIKANTLLKPKDIGALAAAGVSSVLVKKRIKAGIISTGDEIAGIDEPLTGSKVRDVNSYCLYAGLLELGAQPIMYGIVPDSYEMIRKAVDQALCECDLVLISGGSSVGTYDMTCKVIDSFGKPGIFVHGIAIKPGKPTIIAKVKEKPVFGLPGHPVSAYFIFKVFVSHLFKVINGLNHEFTTGIKAYTAFNFPSNDGREEYVPVKLEKTQQQILAHPVFAKSGLITTLTEASGYIKISRGAEGVVAGQEVDVIPF
jgi:molybdopterin molybdotransferase